MRLVYSLTRCWRFYLLFSFASVLTFFLYFISQHDPKLEHYFQYNFYLNGGANVEKIKKLMETNNLDYELLQTNAKFCFNNIDIDEDIALLDNEQEEGRKPSGKLTYGKFIYLNKSMGKINGSNLSLANIILT